MTRNYLVIVISILIFKVLNTYSADTSEGIKCWVGVCKGHYCKDSTDTTNLTLTNCGSGSIDCIKTLTCKIFIHSLIDYNSKIFFL